MHMHVPMHMPTHAHLCICIHAHGVAGSLVQPRRLEMQRRWLGGERGRARIFFFGACRRRTPMGCGVSKGCQYRKVLDERHLQIGAGPRHSPSACPEIPVKKDPCSGLDALVGGLMHEPRSDQPHTVAGWCSLCFSEVADQSYSTIG